jgi:Tol biopolymer transport system component
MASPRSLLFGCALVGSSLGLFPVAPAAAVSPGANGLIAYVVGSEVRTVGSDGIGHGTVTTLGAGRKITDIAWSPDGQYLAIADRLVIGARARPRVLVVGATGAGKQVILRPGRFPNSVEVVRHLAWSPDGRRLAICADLRSSFLAAVDGHRFGAIESRHPDCVTDWSPNGRQLVGFALTGKPNQRTDVVVMRPDGEGRHVIVAGGKNLDPAWSPDGFRIVFCRTTLPGHHPLNVYTVASIGVSLHRLTNTPVRDERNATWSPDGSRILYQRHGVRALWTLAPEGGNQQRVLPAAGPTEPGPRLPAWQPVP